MILVEQTNYFSLSVHLCVPASKFLTNWYFNGIKDGGNATEYDLDKIIFNPTASTILNGRASNF
jgi:hypothetical protein